MTAAAAFDDVALRVLAAARDLRPAAPAARAILGLDTADLCPAPGRVIVGESA